MTHRLSTPNPRPLGFFLLLFFGLIVPPAMADEAAPLPPSVSDTPPPPPVPATVEPEAVHDALVTKPAPAVRRVVETVAYVAQAPAAPLGDPYGFTAWLNGVRGQYGLGAVGFDANLSYWASVNNGQQAAMGMGHHVMGPARRQNAGMGGAETVWSMWMASPAHQAALLDPSITWIGIAAGGAYWTFNAY